MSQWIRPVSYLIAPGSTVTSAAAIETETLKVVESTIFAVPPENGVAGTLESAKEKGSGTVPKGLSGAG